MGWRRGLYIVGIYAPTTDSTLAERQGLHRQVQELLDQAPGSSIQMVAGDFNAEFGRASDGGWSDVLGPFGLPRRSIPGGEWLDWCRTHGFLDAASQYEQRFRGTWWHPRYRTEHVLDHFLLDTRHRWHLVSCKAVHIEDSRPGSGRWFWDPYTDHHPVEIILRQGKLWLPRDTSSPTCSVKPDVAKLWGLGIPVFEYRQQLQMEITMRLQAAGYIDPQRVASWGELVQHCQEAAMEVLGPAPQVKVKPWIEGHWEQLQELDRRVSLARKNDREKRSVPQPWSAEYHQEVCRTRRTFNLCRRERSRALQQWETNYWSDLARRALQADQERNLGEVFKLHKMLGAHKSLKQQDGGRQSVVDVVEERAAWREHFRKIQEGTGQVPDRVWEAIPQNQEVATWMARDPTIEEVERCIGQMKNRKAAGEDGFMAEFLKYGGPLLMDQVFNVVLRAWREAQQAEAGQEAGTWPTEWTVGVVVPLWKQKGVREDRNTWRGVTLLSVGTKVMARLVANRLARWCDPWLHEGQNGFRGGRGTDDTHQISRRIVEEIARVTSDEVVLFRFFDIEKAYPRVCRPAMWEVLKRRGCPRGMLAVLKALHDHTDMKVKVHGGMSETYN